MGEFDNRVGSVRAVILGGSRDFGRCPLATRLPAPLWSLEGKPIFLRLLSHLANAGVRSAVVCGGSDTQLYRDAINGKTDIDLSFLEESLPVGAAGCIRDAAGNGFEGLLIVLHGAMISPPRVEWLINAHLAGKSDLTVFMNPQPGKYDPSTCAGIYICGTDVLGCIPKEGYCDIKEGLIPALWRCGKSVHSVVLPQPSGVFRNTREYHNAVFEYLQTNAFIHTQSQVSASARICGPVTIMENAVIGEDAVIAGPAVIERNTVVEAGAVISRSILWAGTHVDKNARLDKCITFFDSVVPAGSFLEDEALTRQESRLKTAFKKLMTFDHPLIDKYVPFAEDIEIYIEKAGNWAWFGLLAAAFLWLYRPEISQLWGIWLRSDEYSSGLLVPLFAAYIVWSRREKLKWLPKRPLVAGLAIFFAAQLMRFFGLVFMYDSVQRLSMVISIAAIVLYIFGWQVFRRLSPVLLFLFLMLPAPKSVQNNIMLPLQDWATSSAVFSLEMMGFEVSSEGNIIHLGNTTIAVAEACNGLRMITAFFVVSGLVVFLINRAWWEKLIIFASSLPISLFCNTLRLTITAITFTVIKGPLWEKIFHDFGGLAMIPIAIGIVMLELWILKRLTIAPAYNEQTA